MDDSKRNAGAERNGLVIEIIAKAIKEHFENDREGFSIPEFEAIDLASEITRRLNNEGMDF